jgi:hypothetical protein
MTYSAAIKEAYALAPSNIVTIDTIELTNPSGGNSLFLVQQRSNMSLGLETGETVEFEAVPFRFSLPAAGENGRQDLTLAIDNIDRRVSDFVNTAKSYSEPIRCIYRPYLSNDLTRPQMDPPLSLKLTSITATVVEVQAKATFGDVLNMPFPSQLYTRARFPGLGG